MTKAVQEKDFISLSLDKNDWHPSPLPGQIVYITTVDRAGVPNISPKNWVTMAAFQGPVVGFGCNRAHKTVQNTTAAGSFVLNVPAKPLAEKAWQMAALAGQARFETLGLATLPGTATPVPRLADAMAQFECQLIHTAEFEGGEVFLFGKVLAAWLQASAAAGNAQQQYKTLDPAFFLEGGMLTGMGSAQQIPEDAAAANIQEK